MRIDGTLTQWNDDENCGFIAPARGGQEISVDRAAFARDKQMPRLHERLTFELAMDRNGNLRARGVRPRTRCEWLAGIRAAMQPTARRRKRVGQGAAVFLVIASAAYMFSAYLMTVSAQRAAPEAEAQELRHREVHEGLYADMRRTASLD
mgnify:FL=1